MEVLAAVLLALPTVFLGAFLAVLLDGARERMRTRRWVMRNLHNFVDRAQRGPVPPAGAALRAWLSATTAEDLDEEVWRQAWFLSVSTAPDLAPLLRSKAARSVPVEVFNALGAVEEEAETRSADATFEAVERLRTAVEARDHRRPRLRRADRRRGDDGAPNVPSRG